jgi:uncharacterized membrane protein (UPF0127 family)
MSKTVPTAEGSVIKQTVDYAYTDFGKLTSIEAPTATSEGTTDSGSQASSRPRTAVINGVSFRLEIADDDATRAKGMAKRAFLPDDTGLLFIFTQEALQTFWMKDVLIPLDVLFLDSSRKIVDIKTMRPEIGVPENQLQRYLSAAPALYALEINGGLAKQLGLTKGMTVDLQ